MIDLHRHLLQGVDDGPSTPEESLELRQIAVTDGITRAVVSPQIHSDCWGRTRQTIEKNCNNLQRVLNQQNIHLQLDFAAEVRLSDWIMRQIENDEIPFYGEVDGLSIMPLKFPHGHIISGSDKLVAWLLKQNIRPIIAQPECNKQGITNHALLQPYVEAGFWLQVIAGSVLGDFGKRAQKVFA